MEHEHSGDNLMCHIIVVSACAALWITPGLDPAPAFHLHAEAGAPSPTRWCNTMFLGSSDDTFYEAANWTHGLTRTKTAHRPTRPSTARTACASHSTAAAWEPPRTGMIPCRGPGG